MISNLVVNGCSYMDGYAKGGGHIDLAQRLGIANSASLAIGGSANSRILRTTLKHSYQATEPTLYVLGMTFVSRSELPILTVEHENTFEGRWCNPQNQEFSDRYEHFWNRSMSEQFVDITLKTEVYSLLDRLEHLQFQILAAISDLRSRGHSVLVFQQSDDSYHDLLAHPKLQYLRSTNIIDQLQWCAIKYQHEQGVPYYVAETVTWIGPTDTPDNMRHREPGAHAVLNEFLCNYIKQNQIISE